MQSIDCLSSSRTSHFISFYLILSNPLTLLICLCISLTTTLCYCSPFPCVIIVFVNRLQSRIMWSWLLIRCILVYICRKCGGVLPSFVISGNPLPVSVLNLWVKFFTFNKVSIPMITCSLESRLLTLALLPSFPHSHTPRQGQDNSYNDFQPVVLIKILKFSWAIPT